MAIIPRSKSFILYSNKENSQVRIYVTQGEFATTLADFTLYDGSTALDLTGASEVLFSVYQTDNRNTAVSLPVEISNASQGKITVATTQEMSATYDGAGMDCYVQAIYTNKVVKFSGMKIYVKKDPTLDIIAQSPNAQTLINALNKLALIDSGTGTIDIDDTLSASSTNPVQNKKITQKINEMDSYLSGYSFMYDSYGRIFSYTDATVITPSSFGNKDIAERNKCYIWLCKSVIEVQSGALPDAQFIRQIIFEGNSVDELTLAEEYQSVNLRVGRWNRSVFYVLSSLVDLFKDKLAADTLHSQLSNQITTESQKLNEEIANREEIDNKTLFFEVLSGANTSAAKINELANDERTIYRVMINYEWGFLHNIISNSKHSQMVLMDSGKILYRTKAPNANWDGISFISLIPTKTSDLENDSNFLTVENGDVKYQTISNKKREISTDRQITEADEIYYPNIAAVKSFIFTNFYTQTEIDDFIDDLENSINTIITNLATVASKANKAATYKYAVTLDYTNWNNNTQIVSIPSSLYTITQNTEVMIKLSESARTQLDSCGCESISVETVLDNGDYVLTFEIEGEIPTVDISIGLLLTEVIDLNS